MKFRTLTALSLLCCCPGLVSALEQDCALAQEYYAMAVAAKNDYDDERHLKDLTRATQYCPKFEFLMELGELQAGIGDITLGQVDEDSAAVLAATSYAKAVSMAETAQQQAQAIYAWANLVYEVGGNPQLAYQKVMEAKRLDPENSDLLELEEKLYPHIQNPTEREIRRGFEESYFPPVVASKLADAIDLSSNPEGVDRRNRETMRSVLTQINFEFASTRVEPASIANVRTLASTLAADDYQGAEFLLVGHADERGNLQANLDLSQRRADAVYDQMIMLQPELEGRISTQGQGEEKLLVPDAFTESDHRKNRRLEVFMR